ncbi:tetratricopeptide repeat protein [Mucilaginibacter sp. HMF5004]|uniref:type IX secretion system periplasmic lipoprotein PorW/SprE n=1 Tax=Mucilaginibacter rivuli TaxID=2857527 RepID=UPI001C5FB240|nr:tetratricopeptide repeat protein [Mucilaginibacter rivuli]MBW4888403.1 tetratricopeptide repeat protein [Mucilaginibacter rivuli]
MKLLLPRLFNKLNLFIMCVLVAGCTFEKESAFNRSMQNLTTRYNILFNANDVLRQKQEAYAALYPDNYTEILDVYPDTTLRSKTPDKDLEAVVARGNKIISDKEQSRYIGDAYLILGKANYLQANYFNAAEFFSYVVRNYPKDKNLTQDALVWKARTLMRNNQYSIADSVLDTAMLNIFPKQQNIADVYATRMQYDIDKEKYAHAEEMGKQAVHYTHDTYHRLRWTFILAQLQELNHHITDAYNNYVRVENSNAQFEMSFNASLNRIRIQESKDGHPISRIDLLRKLLKDDKNADFIDQIYFQIGELYLAQNNVDEAVKNYKLSVRNSTKNFNQKGLSYLRLAEINFKNKADYTTAKKYYDSTLTSLSPTYPGYQTILKKSNNLQLLADRLQTISREDTLQMLAKLDENARLAKVKEISNRQLLQQATTATAKGNMAVNSSSGVPSPARNTGGISAANNFYFNNASAVSQGYNDFKRVWGNRPNADNWRRSVKSGSESNNVQVAAIQQSIANTGAGTGPVKTTDDVAHTKIQQDLLQNVPLSAAQLQQSNTRIYNAYLDIANFYRDILDDKKEAIATYEMLLARFPNNVNKSVLYYNLYRLYSDVDDARSEKYKNILLKGYPETDFAKVILDPQYNQKLNDKNAEFSAFYSKLFDLVSKRKYADAISRADELIKLYPNNEFLAQVYYLRAVALGHQQKLAPFRTELEEIQEKYPNDRLITPLIKQHINFIIANQDNLAARDTVLMDSDPNEVPFMQQHEKFDQPRNYPNNPVITKVQPQQPKPVTKPAEVVKVTKPQLPKPDSVAVVKPKVVKPDSVIAAKPLIPIVKTDSTAIVKEVEKPSIFSLRDSTNYYFVVNVNTNRTNLAPSRFGIGQFNRANYPNNNNIKHQLKAVEGNQLIYVGRFNSLSSVKAYARAIAPLLPQIMNVPADKYTFFIITQENLDKLANKNTLDSYFDFYQKKY